MMVKEPISILPVRVNPPLTRVVKDLGAFVYERIHEEGISLEHGDIIVISSKLVSVAQGRMYEERLVKPLKDSREIARRYKLDARLAELILRESIKVVGGAAGLLMAYRPEGLVPNSGIDRSNSPKGLLILYPLRPFRTADEIRRRIQMLSGKTIAVVISDSRVLPLRQGTVGLAIGYSGLRGVVDFRGDRDLFGKPLIHTRLNLADCICSATLLVMGESRESTPIAVLKGLREFVDAKPHSPSEHLVDLNECLYMRSAMYSLG